MNEKQIQEVMALVDKYAYQCVKLDDSKADAFRAAIERTLREQVREVPEGFVARTEVVEFAVQRWNSEVSNRPLVNKNRRTLDDCWRAVIREFGGDPDDLVGPDHDSLLSAAPTQPAQAEQPTDGMLPSDVLQSVWNAMQNSADGNDLLSKLEHMRGSIERAVRMLGQSLVRETHVETLPSGTVVTRLELTDEARDSLCADASEIPGAQVSQPKAAQQEPVAWVDPAALLSAKVSRERGGPYDMHAWSEGRTAIHSAPLYTAAPQREPMDVDEIHKGCCDLDANERSIFGAGVRYAERFHHITKGD